MKIRLFIFPFAVLLCSINVLKASIPPSGSLAQQYINNFKDIAISEMHRTGIPASIKLAQGLLESSWGQSELSTIGNNHFGIKCGSSWNGSTFYKKDDDRDGQGNLLESCFRAYNDPYTSYIDHSEFLTGSGTSNRYNFLFALNRKDYKAWSLGLQQAGYATDRNYPKKLINIIETYELYRFDSDSMEESVVLTMDSPNSKIDKNQKHQISNYINGISVVYAQENESLQDLAKRLRKNTDQLYAFNDQFIGMSIDDVLPRSMPIYLTAKKESYDGKQKAHKIRRGESMYAVSQQYGIQLKNLYQYNRIPEGSKPLPGEAIHLSSYVQWGKRPKFEEIEGPRTDGQLLFASEDGLDAKIKRID